jgi:predicted SAM-dependent methyltransferase
MRVDDGMSLLRECRRVIKDSGVVRVTVPDLAHAWVLYQRGETVKMLNDYFYAGEEGSFAQHRYAYDFEMLSGALKETGFGTACRAEFQRGLTPDLDKLDNRAEYSLYVEARP